MFCIDLINFYTDETNINDKIGSGVTRIVFQAELAAIQQYVNHLSSP